MNPKAQPDLLTKLPDILRRATDPAPQQCLAPWLFVRLLALVYLAAFGSLATQITGLVGHDGILPISDMLAELRNSLGAPAIWQFPTVFWLDDSDNALRWSCVAGMAASLAVFFGMTFRAGLLVCYLLYLSLAYAGQDFLSFQWDMLLLEAGFLALLLPDRSRLMEWSPPP